MKYHNNLKQIRLQKGMTIRQVAAAMNLHCEDRICLWENGRSMPSTMNLVKLSKIYSASLEDMFTVG